MSAEQTLQEWIKKSRLHKDQRHAAWEVFKRDGLDQAVAYVTAFDRANRQALAGMELHVRPQEYRVWGLEYIDQASLEQMDNAMRLPISVAGALMPDAHKGYGLPIGGVLATDQVVIPYAVGVDIACRMMITLYPDPVAILDQPESKEYSNLYRALTEKTVFGAGGTNEGDLQHPVLEEAKWQATPLLRGLRKTAIYQLGTSGTGNHFVEWGVAQITAADNPLGLKPGEYLALLSHSGSRGVGYKIASYYSELAMHLKPQLDQTVRHLAWLDLASAEGQEYWAAMELAGEFASANHHLIHERVAKSARVAPIAMIENHHNFAWRESIEVEGEEKEVIVHRKGATPAGKGVLGIIPGTMADAGYLVMGRGEVTALQSASHGGGRQMSRTQAKKTIAPEDHKKYLKERHIKLIGGGLDEAPQAYKNIVDVIQAQADLVDILGTFQPRLVRMAGDEKFHRRGKKAPSDIVMNEGD